MLSLIMGHGSLPCRPQCKCYFLEEGFTATLLPHHALMSLLCPLKVPRVSTNLHTAEHREYADLANSQALASNKGVMYLEQKRAQRNKEAQLYTNYRRLFT